MPTLSHFPHPADTFLCYLYPEYVAPAETQFGSADGKGTMPDGTGVTVHYSERMCFPSSEHAGAPPARLPLTLAAFATQFPFD